MPNWCENDLRVEGPTKEAVDAFLKFAAGESPFDFNRFLPYPEKFRCLDDAAQGWDREHEGRPDYDWFARPKDGFNSGGYEWRVKHWGTKWPARRVQVEGPATGYAEKAVTVFFRFDTAWSPPKPVIEKAAELYPALQFELRYFERGAQFNGFFYCSAGEVETDECGPYFGDRGG